MTPRNKERLYWLAAVQAVAAIGYLNVRYFWPWFVKWCVAQ